MRTRRQLLRAAGAIAAGALAPGCAAPRRAVPAPGPSASTPAAPVSPAPARPAALPPEIDHGPRDRPDVALTFHGQGSPALLDALLGALERGSVHGTVLAVGSWLRQYPEVARRILDGGHELGNHTENHVDLAALDAAGVFREIDGCARVLTDLTGSRGTWFRPSRTRHATAVIRAEAARAGYPTCLAYDVDPLDYTDPGPAAIVSGTVRAAAPGSIVSLHCGHPGTVAAMPAVLAGLAARGLRPVTVTELLGP